MSSIRRHLLVGSLAAAALLGWGSVAHAQAKKELTIGTTAGRDQHAWAVVTFGSDGGWALQIATIVGLFRHRVGEFIFFGVVEDHRVTVDPDFVVEAVDQLERLSFDQRLAGAVGIVEDVAHAENQFGGVSRMAQQFE